MPVSWVGAHQAVKVCEQLLETHGAPLVVQRVHPAAGPDAVRHYILKHPGHLVAWRSAVYGQVAMREGRRGQEDEVDCSQLLHSHLRSNRFDDSNTAAGACKTSWLLSQCVLPVLRK